MKRILGLLLVAACGSSEKRPSQPAPWSPPSAPAAAPNGEDQHCPENMIAIGCFCIDRYEAPNARGELPFAMRTAYEGEAWCAERSKRLCTEAEWLRACQGREERRFPYGDEYRKAACNDDRAWIAVQWKALAKWPDQVAIDEGSRLYQADRSGARGECISEEGVYDLTGNVAEWVRRTLPAPLPGYDHVLKGCYWAGCYHNPQPDCEFTNHAHPGTFRTYEAGFRCCAERLGPACASAVH